MEIINSKNKIIKIKDVSDGLDSRQEMLENRVSDPEDGDRMYSG